MQTNETQTAPPITAEVRQRLESLAQKIRTHRDALAESDSQAPLMAARLERHEAELQQAMKCATPDDEKAVDAIVRGAARKLLLQNAVRAIPSHRQQVMAQLVEDMRELDQVLLTVSPANDQRHFFDLQNREFVRCDEALATIAAKLK